MESGLVTQASPQLGGGMSGIGMPRASSLPSAGQDAAAYFAEPVIGPAGSIPFPSPRVGLGRGHVLSPNPYLVAPSAQNNPLRCPRSRPVLLVPRLTRILLRQGPVPHLSKSEVSRLADRGAALGFGVKLLTYLEELGFLTTNSGTEF